MEKLSTRGKTFTVAEVGLPAACEAFVMGSTKEPGHYNVFVNEKLEKPLRTLHARAMIRQVLGGNENGVRIV